MCQFMVTKTKLSFCYLPGPKSSKKCENSDRCKSAGASRHTWIKIEISQALVNKPSSISLLYYG